MKPRRARQCSPFGTASLLTVAALAIAVACAEPPTAEPTAGTAEPAAGGTAVVAAASDITGVNVYEFSNALEVVLGS